MKKKKPNQQTTRERLNTVRKTLNIFERFYELGYKEKGVVLNQFLIHFPKYDNDTEIKHFTLLWGFKTYTPYIIKDLEIVINKIEK